MLASPHVAISHARCSIQCGRMGLFASLIGIGIAISFALCGISVATAQEKDDGKVSDLQPTQVVADIPDGYGVLFPLQWGGGSLLQLKGRLAIMGCMANNIWLYDDNRWYLYNQYDVPGDIAVVREFTMRYSAMIPPGSLWASCYDTCRLPGEREKECLSFDELRKRLNATDLRPPIGNLPCTDNFDPRVKEHVLPRLPIHPNTCIVRHPEYEGSTGLFVGNGTEPMLIVWGASPDAIKEPWRILHTEIHELCHANQDWHWAQQLRSDFTPFHSWNAYIFGQETDHAQEFNRLVGFVQTGGPGEFYLPPSSAYAKIYSSSPLELQAELCTLYLFKVMGQPSHYEPYIDVNALLSPGIREWLETYMILPQILE